MAGPAKPRTPTFGDMINSKLSKGGERMPGRVIDPNLREVNETIRAANAFNEEREFRASPNHKPRRKLDMTNVGRHVIDTLPTRDRMEVQEDNSVLDQGSGFRNVSDVKKLPALAESDDMPASFKGRPKLKMLWLHGQGLLDPKRQKMLEKAMNDDKFKLDDDDFRTLEVLMPLKHSLTPTSQMSGSPDVDVVMEAIRQTAIGVGAMGGGALGMRGGTKGVIAGGALGASAGSSFVDAVENNINMVGNKLFSKKGEEVFTSERAKRAFSEGTMYTVQDIAKRAAKEGAIDGAVSGVGTFAPMIAKKLKQKLLGITAESVAVGKAGARIGVDMLPVQVGGAWTKTATAVLGRIPWVSGPMKKQAAKQMDQIRNFVDTLPGRISPRNLSDPDVGVLLDIKAQQMFEKDMASLSGRQVKLREAARKQGAFVDTTEVTTVAERWLNTYGSRNINKPDKGTMKLLQQVVDMGKAGKLTIDQWDEDLVAGLRNEMDRLSQHGGEGIRAMGELLESAKLDLAGSGIHGQKQIGMDSAWEVGFQKYEASAAKKFSLLDKNRFKQGVLKMGARNPDELVDMIVAGKSPKMAFDVRGIVGTDAMNDLAARYVDKNIKKSVTFDNMGSPLFDVGKFAKKVGLNDPKGAQYAITKEMLRGTGVTMDMLQDFVRVGRTVGSTKIPDVSTFLARRVVLGGLESGLAPLMGALGPSKFVKGLMLTMLARRGSKMLSNPENIRLVTMAMDANADQAMRRSATLRLFRVYNEDPDAETIRDFANEQIDKF